MPWWKRSKTEGDASRPPPGPDASTTADLAELRRALAAVQGQLEDLDDRFRRFAARARKRWSVDEAEGAAPADGAARSAPLTRNGHVPTAAQLRAEGRWPFTTKG